MNQTGNAVTAFLFFIEEMRCAYFFYWTRILTGKKTYP